MRYLKTFELYKPPIIEYVETSPINRYVYHVSPRKNRPEILKNGLIPSLGDLTLIGMGFPGGQSDWDKEARTLRMKQYRDKFGDYLDKALPKKLIFVIDTSDMNKLFDITKGHETKEVDIWRIDVSGINNRWYWDPILTPLGSPNSQGSICTDTGIPSDNIELVE